NTFKYKAPAAASRSAVFGKRVIAPLGQKIVTGFIVGVSQPADPNFASACNYEIKEIVSIPEEPPFFTEQLWRFISWAADYYFVPVGTALKSLLPPGAAKKSRRWVFLAQDVRSQACEEPQIMDSLPSPLLKKGRMREKDLISLIGESALKDFIKQGLLTTQDYLEIPRALNQCGRAKKPIRALSPQNGSYDPAEWPELTPSQLAAVNTISAAIESGGFQPFLLYGVTGSGKTEVYIRAIAKALERGKDVLVLVPEIALTPQTARVFLDRFEGGVALFHSGLTPAQRLQEWRRIKEREVRIAVAARSGIFLPIDALGLIIVDEEHDPSYKQEDGFPYNARDLALVRGKLEAACVILGSATPSFETFENARRGKITRIDLPERYHAGQMPTVEIVDLKDSKRIADRKGFLTPLLLSHIRDMLDRGEQALLFLNRRGFDTFVQCKSCGFIFRCPNCDISLTHHKSKQQLRCHLCGYSQFAPPVCPKCASAAMSFHGIGTQKVEEELKKLFPASRIERLDRDAAHKQEDLVGILERFRNHEIDILTGTQMIVKGHDFARISLVGVLYGDASLHFPDFRAAERTFQVLTQVSGRAGRDRRPSSVLFQTFDTEHPVIRYAARQAYEEFFQHECEVRRELAYPPFGHLILMRLEGNSETKVEQAAIRLGSASRMLKASLGGVTILGPAPSPRKKAGGKYRWQVLLKGPKRENLRRLVQQLHDAGHLKHAGVKVAIDVDPVEMM
ncbi:MAG: replication restart helicase PriA, partial [Desulfomonilaceae bacterium]